MEFATKPQNITHLTLGMSLHYYGTLNIQIFRRYSEDMEESANKLHLNAPIVIPLHVQLCILSVFTCFFYQNLVFVTEYHVDC